MPETINLSSMIEERLPAELVAFLRLAGETARGRGWRLYLVGGVVRDLLLGRANLDLDLVVEGDGIALAQELASAKRGKTTVHTRFGTAKVQWNGWSADVTTARSETYAKPGALPTVTPGPIKSDLFRRDFSINAMAVDLTPEHYGEIIDLYGGRNDLGRRLVRVLHEKSFTDDATRIWRAIRYEQRLDFRIEPTTLELLRGDTAMLDTISGDRIWYELECALKEERPEKLLRRAGELGVLQRLHPSLKGDGWLAGKFEQARRLCSPERTVVGLYLALMAYPLSAEETEGLISRLRLPKTLSRIIRDTSRLKSKVETLADPTTTPSGIFRILNGCAQLAITAISIASDSPGVINNIELFLDKLRYIKPSLSGDDLKRMGITPAPRIGEMLQMLHDAKLDGKAKTKEDERRLVEGWKGK